MIIDFELIISPDEDFAGATMPSATILIRPRQPPRHFRPAYLRFWQEADDFRRYRRRRVIIARRRLMRAAYCRTMMPPLAYWQDARAALSRLAALMIRDG